MQYITSIRFLLLLAALIAAPTLVEVVCPPAETYTPCWCSSDFNSGYSDFILIECGNLYLGDERIEKILDVLLTPDISPVSWMDLSTNNLTRVPRNFNQFKQLNIVYLDDNFIKLIPSGSFNLVGYNKQLSKIVLSNNHISKIEAGAFKGNFFDWSTISLDGNPDLNRIEADVFFPVLQQMNPYANAFIELTNDPIDCESDPCHLAWLVRDNPNMLKNLRNAFCQNGTALSSLKPDTICPTTPKTTTTATFTTGTTIKTALPGGPFICPQPNGYFPNPSSCSSFYSCSNNTPYLFDCPANLVYNPKTVECDYNYNVVGC